jgi:hypothetical protein
MNQRKTFRNLIFSVLAFPALPLFAEDGIQIGVGVLQGALESEFEGKLFKDSMINENFAGGGGVINSFGYENLWSPRSKIAPELSLAYEKSIADLPFIFSLGYVEHKPNFTFDGFGILEGGLGKSFVTGALPDFKESDTTFDIGVKLHVLDHFGVTPKVGYWSHSLSTSHSATEFGNLDTATLMMLQSSTIDADSAGMFLRVNADYEISEHLALIAQLTYVPTQHGDMSRSRTTIEQVEGMIGMTHVSETMINNDSIRSGYDYSANHLLLGIEYRVAEHTHLEIGYKIEQFNISMPGYMNTLRIGYAQTHLGAETSATIPTADLVSNASIYGEEEHRKDKYFLFGLKQHIEL